MQGEEVREERQEITAHADGCWSWVMGAWRFTSNFIFVLENFL